MYVITREEIKILFKLNFNVQRKICGSLRTSKYTSRLYCEIIVDKLEFWKMYKGLFEGYCFGD